MKTPNLPTKISLKTPSPKDLKRKRRKLEKQNGLLVGILSFSSAAMGVMVAASLGFYPLLGIFAFPIGYKGGKLLTAEMESIHVKHQASGGNYIYLSEQAIELPLWLLSINRSSAIPNESSTRTIKWNQIECVEIWSTSPSIPHAMIRILAKPEGAKHSLWTQIVNYRGADEGYAIEKPNEFIGVLEDRVVNMKQYGGDPRSRNGLRWT